MLRPEYTYPQFLRDEAKRKRRRKLAAELFVVFFFGWCLVGLIDVVYEVVSQFQEEPVIQCR